MGLNGIKKESVAAASVEKIQRRAEDVGGTATMTVRESRIFHFLPFRAVLLKINLFMPEFKFCPGSPDEKCGPPPADADCK